MSQHYGGTGESRVYIRSNVRYHTEILPDSIEGITRAVCSYYGLDLPTIEILPKAKRRWGCYYPQEKRVTLNQPIKLGIILHELAHYINHQTNPNRNGHHDIGFSVILNELFEVWNV